MASPSSPPTPQPRRRPARPLWWVVPGGILLALLYLPTLTTRFDFTDDGNLVYPTGPLPLAERAAVVWEKIVANYQHLGPFRPVLWVHWEVAADLMQGSEPGWRALRLAWCAFSACALLWLLAELGVPAMAALVAGAVAVWNPYRNEIWTSLTLSEGVAMPYALLALVCARRAVRSRRALAWDLAGAACVLAALGCKNTFAALVPAQMYLRLAADGVPLRECVRRYGLRAALLGLTLLAPAAHFVYFKLHWHPGQYTTGGPSVDQLRRLVSGLLGAMSLPFLGAGLALAAVALVASRGPATGLATRFRAALGAAALLLCAGVAVYLPMGAVSGRYTMPAVWGLDIALAVLVSGLLVLPRSTWVRASWVALGLGLVAVLVANVGKQQKFAARSQVLWDALERVERQAPPNASLAWVCGDSLQGGLNVEEGIHFQWHLAARGRRDVRVGLYDDQLRPLERCEISQLDREPELAVWGPAQATGVADWRESDRFVAQYWGGKRQYECRLGQRGTAAN